MTGLIVMADMEIIYAIMLWMGKTKVSLCREP